MASAEITARFARLALIVVLVACWASARQWSTSPRSQAKLDALARVQIKSYAFTQAGNDNFDYGLAVPVAYSSSLETPLIVALHGEGGGLRYMMEYGNLIELADQHGYIVATPMGFNERGWYGARGPGNDFNAKRADPGPANLGELSEQDVLNVLREVRGAFNIDSHRVYLIGQSMGGGGTYWVASRTPQTWAALAVMAPAVAPRGAQPFITPAILAKLAHVPIMVIQGDADQAVDVIGTRAWVAEMASLGMSYEYIEVAGGTHASAGRANVDKIFEFMAKHRKP